MTTTKKRLACLLLALTMALALAGTAFCAEAPDAAEPVPAEEETIAAEPTPEDPAGEPAEAFAEDGSNEPGGNAGGPGGGPLGPGQAELILYAAPTSATDDDLRRDALNGWGYDEAKIAWFEAANTDITVGSVEIRLPIPAGFEAQSDYQFFLKSDAGRLTTNGVWIENGYICCGTTVVGSSYILLMAWGDHTGGPGGPGSSGGSNEPGGSGEPAALSGLLYRPVPGVSAEARGLLDAAVGGYPGYSTDHIAYYTVTLWNFDADREATAREWADSNAQSWSGNLCAAEFTGWDMAHGSEFIALLLKSDGTVAQIPREQAPRGVIETSGVHVRLDEGSSQGVAVGFASRGDLAITQPTAMAIVWKPDPDTPTVAFTGSGNSSGPMTAQLSGTTEGIYVRVALVMENNGQTGLYVTQVDISQGGSIQIPTFSVPGLTVKAVNIALVGSLEDIQSRTPAAIASDFLNL